VVALGALLGHAAATGKLASLLQAQQPQAKERAAGQRPTPPDCLT
jgi:hypothetical protein